MLAYTIKMQLPVILKSVLVFFMVSVFYACEEEGEPLTLQDIYAATAKDKEPFRAKINGFEFSASAVGGGKENGSYYVIGVDDAGSSITIHTIDIVPGSYRGIDSSANYILFRNAQGRLFSSIGTNKKPDALISIRSYSPENMLISGVFSSSLYSVDSEEKLSLTNGEFNSAFIVLPFVGTMTAELDGVAFKAEKCSATSSQNNGILTQQIEGLSNNDSIRISLTIEDELQVKSYDFADPKVQANYNPNTYSSNLSAFNYTGISGSLNIVRIDNEEKKVVGNFGFEAINAKGEKVSVKYGDFQALME